MEDVGKIPHLILRGAQWYFRRGVPKDLRELIGKREIKYSLGSNYQEAIAACRVYGVETDNLFLRKRRELGNTISTDATENQIKQMVMTWFHRQEREGVKSHHAAILTLEEIEEALEIANHDEAAVSNDNATEGMLQTSADQILHTNRVRIDKSSGPYQSLCRWIQRAELELVRRRRKRLLGEYNISGLDPIFETIGPESPLKGDVGSHLTFMELVKRYKSDPKRAHLSEKTRLSEQVKFKFLGELIGNERRLDSISREDCRNARDLLIALPTNVTKRFPDLSLRRATIVAKARKLKTISAKTVNSYLFLLSSLFRYANNEEYMTSNPAQGLSVSSKTSRKDARLPFSTDQLKAIFNTPLYTGCQDDERGWKKEGPNIIRRGRFWVPLLSLYSGMRLNECCQLHVEDIVTRDGVSLILVQENEGSKTKRLKTPSATRMIPVHPELVNLGFLKYVQQMKRRKRKRLFLELSMGKTGYYSDPFQKWFRRLMESAKATAPRTSFHSFRHTFRDALREAQVSEEVVRQLCGWSGGGMENVYGSGFKPTTLAQEMAKIQFEGLSLSSLYQP